MVSFRRLSHKLCGKTTTWIGIGLAATAATRIYYVQEMIAALIIFSILFLGVAIVALIVFLLDRASEGIVAWAEVAVPRAGHWFACIVEDAIVWPISARAASYRLIRGHRTGRKKY